MTISPDNEILEVLRAGNINTTVFVEAYDSSSPVVKDYIDSHYPYIKIVYNIKKGLQLTVDLDSVGIEAYSNKKEYIARITHCRHSKFHPLKYAWNVDIQNSICRGSFSRYNIAFGRTKPTTQGVYTIYCAMKAYNINWETMHNV